MYVCMYIDTCIHVHSNANQLAAAAK